MHCTRLLFLLTASLALAGAASAQTRPGLPANGALLKRKAGEWRREENQAREAAYAWARKKGWPVHQVLPDGSSWSCNGSMKTATRCTTPPTSTRGPLPPPAPTNCGPAVRWGCV
jgi:hypothetical protein